MDHRDIISKWPTTADLARDLGLPAERYVTVYSWHRRGFIPLKRWPAVIEAARARKIKGVTQAALMDGALSRANRPERAA